MSEPRMIPSDILWQKDGHLSDVALDALADGQDALVPLCVREHANECEPCAIRLGDAFLLSAQARTLLQQQSYRQIPWPLSLPSLLTVLVLALLGALPSLGGFVAKAQNLAHTLSAVVPNLTRALVVLSRSEDMAHFIALVFLIAIVVLLAGAATIVRSLPRQTASYGETR
ncbi:MAG TPA: hypothetical protein PLV85_25015 [Polyangiaceae bacterium]|nr:hypothetical protein [Polyangiaceae bacterium]